jgi:hypothetical protein
MAEVESRDVWSKPGVSDPHSIISYNALFTFFIEVAADNNVEPLVVIEVFWLAGFLIPRYPTYDEESDKTLYPKSFVRNEE